MYEYTTTTALTNVSSQGKVREVRSADAAVAHSLQGTVYSDLTFLRWAVQLGNHGFVATMEHRRLSRSFSVKVTHLFLFKHY
jgi:hypothetical protein